MRRTDLRLKQEWLPVITWAGVRGSLSMVLAMMLIVSAKGEAGTAAEVNRLVLLNIVYGVVLMSILLQGTTMAWLMKRGGLIVESREETEYELALARRQASRVLLENLESSERKGTLSHETFDTLHRQLLARREANDKRIAHMLEHTSSLNTIELQIESTHLSALEKQVYRDLEKAGDLDYDSMEALVREVVDRKE